MIIKNQPDTALATELIEMEKADQAMRTKYQAGEIAWDYSVDAKHTKRLKQIVEASGWPTVSKVGEEGAGAAWLLAQHADHDPAFQQQCLVLMKQAEEGEVKPAYVAYLEDRVRVHMGQPQRYGTQFYKEGKTLGPSPIEDEEHIDERRAAVGLGPFSEYYEEIMKLYG